MISTSILVALLVCCLPQVSWSRYLSVSLNLSLSLSNEQHTPQRAQGLTADIVRICMRNTKASMLEVRRFHASLLTNPSSKYFMTSSVTTPDDEPKSEEDFGDDMPTIIEDDQSDYDANENIYNIEDYDTFVNRSSMDLENIVSAAAVAEYDRYMDKDYRQKWHLECFTHCLYEQMGLLDDGIFKETEVMEKLYDLMNQKQSELPECMILESSDKCEAVYRMHLCYAKLKTVEAHRKFGEILEIMEASDNTNDFGSVDDIVIEIVEHDQQNNDEDQSGDFSKQNHV